MKPALGKFAENLERILLRQWIEAGYLMSGAAFAFWRPEGDRAMFHMIEFNAPLPDEADEKGSSADYSEPLRLRKITRAIVRLRPYVVEIDGDLVEVADLHFEDGTVAARVPYARFHFVN
jgi:hypothetical protein